MRQEEGRKEKYLEEVSNSIESLLSQLSAWQMEGAGVGRSEALDEVLLNT